MPSHRSYVFAGVGNAAIDVTCSVSDVLLADMNVPKGSCAFPDDAAVALIEDTLARNGIDVALEPGGSAANVACTIGALGGKSAFIGKAAKDRFGDLFGQSIARWGVANPVSAIDPAIAPTTRIYTFITPDGERSFAAYYGSSNHLVPADVDEGTVARAAFLGVDGYSLAWSHGFETSMRAIELAKKHDTPVMFAPSAPSIIENWKPRVDTLLAACDAIICNTHESLLLTGAADAASALPLLAHGRQFAAITVSADGAIAMDGAGVAVHRPNPAFDFSIVNTNGAGDNFSAGFLYGRAQGWALDKCLDLGLACAVNVLKLNGPRPDAPLDRLAARVATTAA